MLYEFGSHMYEFNNIRYSFLGIRVGEEFDYHGIWDKGVANTALAMI